MQDFSYKYNDSENMFLILCRNGEDQVVYHWSGEPPGCVLPGAGSERRDNTRTGHPCED